MLIKVLIFLLALMAHGWLWGQWTLDSTIKANLLLGLATLFLLIMVILPIRAIIKKKNPKQIFSTIWMQTVFYSYLFLIILMSVFSFSGWIQVLLPIKVLLLVSYVGLRFYLKKKPSPSSPN